MLSTHCIDASTVVPIVSDPLIIVMFPFLHNVDESGEDRKALVISSFLFRTTG